MTRSSASGIGTSSGSGRTLGSGTMLCSGTTCGFGTKPLALFVLHYLELEPQHFDDSVGVLLRIVLFATGLVAEDAVVAVAVLWHVAVFRVFCTESHHRFSHSLLSK